MKQSVTNKLLQGKYKMKRNSFFKSLPFKLLVGVVIGILAGLALNANDGTGLTNAILNIVVTLKF